jgi:hypothetical protein
MLLRVPPEVLEGPLVRVEELGQGLIEAGIVVAAPTEAQGEDEDPQLLRRAPEPHGHRAPVDLALEPRRGLEPGQGAFGAELGRPQRPDEELHGVVAAGVAALPELLEEDLGRAVDLRGPGAEVLRMGGQQRVRPRRPPVRLPRRVADTAPDRLPVQVEAAGQRRDGHPLGRPEPPELFPTFPSDHRHLLV